MLRSFKGIPEVSEMIYKIIYRDICIFLGKEHDFHQGLKESHDPQRLETTAPSVSSNLGKKHFDHLQINLNGKVFRVY